jgi:hypothetical protein
MVDRWISKDASLRIGKKINDTQERIDFLFGYFSEKKEIFHLIQPVDFDSLNLELNDTIIEEAKLFRMKSLEVSNQFSDARLFEAYLKNDRDDASVLQDKSKLIMTAKKLAVIRCFQNNFSKTKN